MTEVLIGAAIIALLVLANGLFVAAEFAIVCASRASIEHRAAQGSRLAQRVARVQDDANLQDRYIATTQIGISLASLGLGMYGEEVMAHWIAAAAGRFDTTTLLASHAVATTIALTLLTYLHIVLGEMVPKALALQRAERTALIVSPIVTGVGRAILPLVRMLNAFGNGVLRAFGIERKEQEAERYHSSTELELIIRESEEGGMLRGDAGRLLRELFEFGDLTARQVMVPRVHTVAISADATPEELRTIVRTRPHTRYPIFTGDLDHIAGSMHIKELLQHVIREQPISERAARPVPYVPATAPLDQVLASMRRFRSQLAVVMDEQGGTAGIVTIEDLFEEVVGEIDEGRGRRPIVRDPSGRLLVRGTVRLKDAGDAIGVPLHHPDVQSISGLVLLLLGRPALDGDTVVWNGVRIQVTAVDGRGVGEAALQREAAATGERSNTSQK